MGPAAENLPVTVEGSVDRFTFERSGKLAIDLGWQQGKPLYLFATAAPRPGVAGVATFSVSQINEASLLTLKDGADALHTRRIRIQISNIG